MDTQQLATESDGKMLRKEEKDRLQKLVGEGWGFPMRMTVQGGFQFSHNDRNLEESIAIILGTRLGERVYRPEFGSRLHELVFAPLNDETLLLAQIYAREALQQWEPRIIIEAVSSTPIPDAASLNIMIHYRVRQSSHRHSFVYPFYLNTAV